MFPDGWVWERTKLRAATHFHFHGNAVGESGKKPHYSNNGDATRRYDEQQEMTSPRLH